MTMFLRASGSHSSDSSDAGLPGTDATKRIFTTKPDELPKIRKTLETMTKAKIVRETKLGSEVLLIVTCSDENLEILLRNHPQLSQFGGLQFTSI